MLLHLTLPWEHRAVPRREELPWLALLLFDEQESPEIKIKRLTVFLRDRNLTRVLSAFLLDNLADRLL